MILSVFERQGQGGSFSSKIFFRAAALRICYKGSSPAGPPEVLKPPAGRNLDFGCFRCMEPLWEMAFREGKIFSKF